MSDGQPSTDDRDLLSRLNALKKSYIELDETKPVLASHLGPNEVQHVNPAQSLFSDLTTRFQGLKSAHNRGYTHDELRKDGTPLDIPELQNDDNDKTVEELLAELGPDDQWTLGKDEDVEIDALLKDAHSALLPPDSAEVSHEAKDMKTRLSQADSTGIDLEVEPASESGDDDTEEKEATIDQEAESILQRLLDEIALDPIPSTLISQADGDHEAGLDLTSSRSEARTAGPQEPELDPPPPYCAGSCLDEAVDDELARRFASLGLPQNEPQADDGLNLPSVPTGIKTQTKTAAKSTPPEDEIDTWCIICLDDANLKCLGCDGDLYCTKCWMEGHTGEDAGYEEKKHRAVQYVKGGGLKKEKRRLVGA